jgi:chromosome segregation ATPase
MTDVKDIEAVVAELEKLTAEWGHPLLREVAPLILAARRARDSMHEDLGFTEGLADAYKAERDAAREEAAQWARQHHQLGTELDKALVRVQEGHKRETGLCSLNDELNAHAQALEERVNQFKLRLECNWCEGVGRKDDVACNICDAGNEIIRLEAMLEEKDEKWRAEYNELADIAYGQTEELTEALARVREREREQRLDAAFTEGTLRAGEAMRDRMTRQAARMTSLEAEVAEAREEVQRLRGENHRLDKYYKEGLEREDGLRERVREMEAVIEEHLSKGLLAQALVGNTAERVIAEKDARIAQLEAEGAANARLRHEFDGTGWQFSGPCRECQANLAKMVALRAALRNDGGEK